MDKIVYAGANQSSFEQGSDTLAKLAEVDVSAKQVERVCKRIGQERLAERAQQVQEYQSLPLVERKSTPPEVTPPKLAVVSVDGGRLQIRERSAQGQPEAEALPSEVIKAEDGRGGKHWREDKIGLLMTMQSTPSATDPCPQIPASFVDATRIVKLVRDLKKCPALGSDGVSEASEATVAEASEPFPWEPPEVLEKRLVASRCRWPDFGPLLANAAWRWGFYGAERRAFIADGSDHNWSIWRHHFSSFEPIVDFIHALSYVFSGALAGRSLAEGWSYYERWISWLWQGEVEQVIGALTERQQELGAPLPDEAESSPRQVVATALVYLRNQKERMRYGEYRRAGLPITSSYVESAVKQINRRVKGTEKFWSEQGAEALLQLRADYLSDDDPLTEFWQRRQESETGQRRYCLAV